MPDLPATAPPTVPPSPQLPPPKKLPFPYLKVGLGIVFAALIVINLAAVYLFIVKPHRMNRNAAAPQTKTAAATGSAVTVTDVWLTFPTDRDFSFRYPPDWSVQLSTSDVGPSYIFSEKPIPIGGYSGDIGTVSVEFLSCSDRDNPKVPCDEMMERYAADTVASLGNGTRKSVTVMGKSGVRIAGTSDDRQTYPDGEADLMYAPVSDTELIRVTRNTPRIAKQYDRMLTSLERTLPRGSVVFGTDFSVIIPPDWSLIGISNAVGSISERITLKSQRQGRESFCYAESSSKLPDAYVTDMGVTAASESATIGGKEAVVLERPQPVDVVVTTPRSPDTLHTTAFVIRASGKTFGIACLTAAGTDWKTDPGIKQFIAGFAIKPASAK
jgi:hypothetical protein